MQQFALFRRPIHATDSRLLKTNCLKHGIIGEVLVMVSSAQEPALPNVANVTPPQLLDTLEADVDAGSLVFEYLFVWEACVLSRTSRLVHDVVQVGVVACYVDSCHELNNRALLLSSFVDGVFFSCEAKSNIL